MKLKPQKFISHGALVRISEAAKEYWKRNNYKKIIELLEPAIRLDPSNFKMLLDLGLAHAMNQNFPVAERYFERAISFSPQKTQTLTTIGTHCQNMGRYDLASGFLERATQQKDTTAEAFARLAEVYERQRRLNDAATMLDRALHLDAACAPAMLLRAKMDRQSGQLGNAEGLLRSVLANPGCNESTRVETLYELGALLDRQARYDEAMSAFLEAKALLLPGAAPFMGALHTMQAHVKEARENISENLLQRWFDSGATLQPPRKLALLCGHPRSGTTLLEQVLDAHPEIISAEETEILHEKVYLPFDGSFTPGVSVLSVLDAVPNNLLQQCRNDYFRATEEHFGTPIGERLLIDKNPSLTVLLPMILRVFPEIKFLVALRDPRDVVLSCFMQPQPLNPASSAWLTLDGAVTDYTSMMGLWLAIKPKMRNPAIEVRYEDMVENLEPVARRVIDFLGFQWDERVLRFDEHARSKVVKSPTYADVTKPIFKRAVGRWKNYQKYLEPYLERLAPFAKEFGYE